MRRRAPVSGQNISEMCIHRAALVNVWAIRTVSSVRRIRPPTRLVVEVTNIGSQTAIEYRSKFTMQGGFLEDQYGQHDALLQLQYDYGTMTMIAGVLE